MITFGLLIFWIIFFLVLKYKFKLELIDAVDHSFQLYDYLSILTLSIFSSKITDVDKFKK